MGLRARSGAAAFAIGAILAPAYAYLFLTAENRFFKCKIDLRRYVFAGDGGRPGASAADTAAEETPEDIAYIAKIPEIYICTVCSVTAGPSAEIGIDARKAELVVLGLFVRIRQNGVRFVDLFKFFLSRLIAGMQIGMILFGQLAVGPLYLIVRGAL